MNSITSSLFDGMVESKYMLGTTGATDVMDIIVFMVRFQLVSMKATHYAELKLSQRLGHLQESPFLKIKNRSQRVQILLTATRGRREIGSGREREEKKAGVSAQSPPALLLSWDPENLNGTALAASLSPI